MKAENVEQYLQALDEALVSLGLKASIPVLLLGGAYIMLQVNARRTTRDIDIFAFVTNETDPATGLSLAVGLYQAAESVAQRYRLHPSWLNTIRIGALQPRGVEPPRRLWKKYQVLEVFFPEAEYVLLQKLLVNRRKDRQDILALFRTLGITTRSQTEELLGRYTPPGEQERQRLEVTLDSYFST